jgi:AAA family ATP:ADP antiporter
LTVNVAGTRDDFQGNWGAFAGSLNLAGSGDFRIANFQTSVFTNSKLNIGSGVNVYQTFNPPTGAGTETVQQIGELSGSGNLGGNPVAGIMIVLRSPYLLGIASFVVLLSAVNTFLYFEQLRIVSETFADTTARTEMFATIDFVVQSLTIFSQLFLTGRIASRLGVRTLLTFVPLIMIGGFMLLSVFNVFGMIALLLVLRRWGEYAFIRPGREMLWGSLDKESKYKAKSFIDVPVYRAADYVGAQAKSALDAVGATPAGAAIVGAGIAALWAANGWMLGRRYDRGSEDKKHDEP